MPTYVLKGEKILKRKPNKPTDVRGFPWEYEYLPTPVLKTVFSTRSDFPHMRIVRVSNKED